ncbi:MAG: glycosyltransferase family 9 protein, partial [Phycisphaerae bacterium]|nr:glycosyltransferase family 9 protein [Phycisphaerae bacterium]
GSGGRAKCWPADSFAELARRMRPQCQPVFVLGPTEYERMGSAVIDGLLDEFAVVQPASLDHLLYDISSTDVYVGNDSGPTHLAAAMGVPTIALFGPTNPAIWGPRGARVSIIRGDVGRGPEWGISPEQVAAAIVLLKRA